MRGLIESMTFSMVENLRMGFVIQTVIQPGFGGRIDMIGRHEHAFILIYQSNDVLFFLL